MPPRPVEAMSDAQIAAEIDNHRRHKLAGRPYGPANADRFCQLLKAQAARAGLDPDKTVSAIAEAACEGRFLSYKDLADASGAEWSRVYLNIGRHLWTVVEWAHAREMPMLSAIVVNRENLATGTMKPATLTGFVKAAEELGHVVHDPEAFLREQQKEVFAHFKRS